MHPLIPIYVIIGLCVGLFFQLVRTIALKWNLAEEEELPEFSIIEHLQVVLLWPLIMAVFVMKLIQRQD